DFRKDAKSWPYHRALHKHFYIIGRFSVSQGTRAVRRGRRKRGCRTQEEHVSRLKNKHGSRVAGTTTTHTQTHTLDFEKHPHTHVPGDETSLFAISGVPRSYPVTHLRARAQGTIYPHFSGIKTNDQLVLLKLLLLHIPER
ncbi:unnamed protein product, partial [Ectocarpus sp. 4 AP-2014]